MQPSPLKSVITADSVADKRSYIIVAFFLVVFAIVNATSIQMEIAAGRGINRPIAASWIDELSSAFGIAALLPLIVLGLNYWPDSRGPRIFLIGAGMMVFTVLHVLIMAGLRTILYPLIIGDNYSFGVLRWEPWIYEMRKDAVTYSLIVGSFWVGRHIGYLKEERAARESEASQSGQITLKSGGRIIFLKAGDIISAQSAANYVDIETRTGSQFVRITLSELLSLLVAAGGDHIRIHRSHLVSRSAIIQIKPTGNGEAQAILQSDAILPVSRKFRSQFA